jgi:hypothetical protein
MSDQNNQTVTSDWENAAAERGPAVNFQRQSESPYAGFERVQASQSEVHQRLKLAEELVNKGYHPVLLFGTRASGKSSLLASLFYYLQSDPDSPAFSVRGEWIVPTDSVYGQAVADAATRFLNHVIDGFYDGKAAPRTEDEHPFYIPIVLRPNNGQAEIKFAFLESRGEWYQINRDSKDLFPALRDEVSDIYQNFPNPISVLLIAPYVMGEAYSDTQQPEWSKKEMKDSDTALVGALQAYQMARQHRELDKHLFILTKWDAHTRSIVDKEFVKPQRGKVSHLIYERFPKSWTLFQTMQVEEAQSMQYSAGVMSGDARVQTPHHLRPIMNRFPQMLWGWLYANASGGQNLFLNIQNQDTGGRFTNPLASLMAWFRKLLT